MRRGRNEDGPCEGCANRRPGHPRSTRRGHRCWAHPLQLLQHWNWTSACVSATVILPLVSHGLEIVVHLARGTPELLVSILASASLTVLSTSFNVFAMRRGALTTGEGRHAIVTASTRRRYNRQITSGQHQTRCK